MRAFLGIAALCFGVSGIAAASAQSLSEAAAGSIVIRTLKGDRVLAPQPEAVSAAEEAQSAFAKATEETEPVEAEETLAESSRKSRRRTRKPAPCIAFRWKNSVT